MLLLALQLASSCSPGLHLIHGYHSLIHELGGSHFDVSPGLWWGWLFPGITVPSDTVVTQSHVLAVSLSNLWSHTLFMVFSAQCFLCFWMCLQSRQSPLRRPLLLVLTSKPVSLLTCFPQTLRKHGLEHLSWGREILFTFDFHRLAKVLFPGTSMEVLCFQMVNGWCDQSKILPARVLHEHNCKPKLAPPSMSLAF